jgi:SET domain-containing protein
MIEVKQIQSKGRGIVATQDIAQGTLIEIAPVVSFPLQQIKPLPNLHQTEIFKYYFVQPSEDDQSKNQNGYLAFGLVSLLNHTENPNTRINWIEDEVGLWSHLIADKEIKMGEEVTMYYGNIDEYNDAKQFVK